MDEKERIKYSPFLIYNKARRYYDDVLTKITKLDIEIEIIDRKEKLVVSLRKVKFGERTKDHGEQGRFFFNELMIKYSFGKVFVKIPNRDPIEFDNYEEFLNEIASD